MRIVYCLTRPLGLKVLTVLVIAVSFLICRYYKPAQVPVLAVLRKTAGSGGRVRATRIGLLLVPYARWIARINATECPVDFFQAWEKYVCDVRTLSAIDRAETGKGMLLISGAAHARKIPASHWTQRQNIPDKWRLPETPLPPIGKIVKHVALRYGIKIARVMNN